MVIRPGSQPDPNLPLAGYLRISDADLADIRRALRNGDITQEEAAELERKGVLKQREDVQQLADRHGRPVVFYEDNNLSAFKKNVVREDFLRMLKDLKAGRRAGIIAYDIDRGFRQPRDLEKVIDIYEEFDEKRHIKLIFDTLSGQNFDLTTGDGRFNARLFVSIANKSSEDTSRRIKRDNASKAKKGVYHGGTPAYGWRLDDRGKLDEEAAERIRHIVDGHLAGDKIQTCMQYLYEQGVVNPNTGKPFSWAGTKTLIFRARNFGIRIYLGEPQLDDNGDYILGPWEPIFTTADGKPDFEKFERLMALKNPAANTLHEKTQLKYLLGRIIRCGRCGYPMSAKPVWVRGKKSNSYAYNCDKYHPEACGKMAVAGPRVDDLVRKLVWRKVLEASETRRLPEENKEWPKEAELKEVGEEIKELKQLWEAREVRAATYVKTLDELEARRAALRGERAVALAAPVARTLTPDLLKQGWEGISLERQRIIIRTILEAVIVHPSKGGRGGPFDPSRIEPVWA